MRAVSLRRTLALCASLFAAAALPASAAATSTEGEVDSAVAKAADYVRSQQEVATGAIPGFGGDWATTALAAADVDAADVRGPDPGDPSLRDFLLGEYTLPTWDENPPMGTVAEYARSTLVSYAAGLDPARLSASSNQPAQLAGRWNPATGSFGEASSYNTAFAILAMKAAGLPRWALEPIVSFLRRNQHDDGGWTFTAALTPAAQGEPSEEDMTGAAVAALCEAGAPAYDPDVAAALSFLRGRLNDATGGIEYLWGFPAGSPNADTNAWVVSGLTACGIDAQSPEWTTSTGKTPVDYLLSLQIQSGPEAGGFGYEDTSAANLYATQDALRAIAGGVFTAAPQSLRTPPAVAAGTPVPHVLAIELAPGNVRICKVTAPAGAPLAEVLAAAEATSYPAGCVSSFEVSGGEVESIDGVAPEGEDEAWLARLDRGSAAVAGEQSVGFGEVIALRLGPDPSTAAGSAGPPGAAGATGPGGAVGPTGPRGFRGLSLPCGRPHNHAHRRAGRAPTATRSQRGCSGRRRRGAAAGRRGCLRSARHRAARRRAGSRAARWRCPRALPASPR